MTRICMPMRGCAGIDHPTAGRVYARTGIVDVPDHVARDLIKYDQCFPASNKPLGVSGRTCSSCGFEGYFKICGRCGGDCPKVSGGVRG